MSETSSSDGGFKQVVLVCTGNTCRSPMGEVLLKKLLSEALGCADDELSAHGWDVVSAGLSAHAGSPASEGALNAVAARGLDLSGHQSQSFDASFFEQCFAVLCMDVWHQQAVAQAAPEGCQVSLVNPEGGVPDPFGASAEVYESCLEMIEAGLRHHLAQWLPS